MKRFLLAAGCAAGLAGCAAGGPSPGHAPVWPAPGATARYDFGWRLSGNRRVAPLQVFDDGRDTWLQFRVGQPVPAIFIGGPGGDRLVPYARQDPYVRVHGVWPTLLLRGGGLQARVDSLRAQGAAGASSLAGARDPGGGAPPAATPGAQHAAPVSIAGTAAPSGASPAPVRLPNPRARSVVPPAGGPGRTAVARFQAGPADHNMRRVLSRWAQQAGWTFESEHWALDVDIPLAGSAVFTSDFRKAVRDLLASTELADRPAQPCFYSNRVLRVIPLAQHCHRTVARGEPS